jgi:diaminopimelate epimerase
VDVWMGEFDKSNTGHITLLHFQQGMGWTRMCGTGSFHILAVIWPGEQ